MALPRVIQTVLIAALAITMGSAILALVLPDAVFGWRLTGTGGLLVVGSLALLPTLRSWETRQASTLVRIATIAIATMMVLGLLAIWHEPMFGRTGFDVDRLWLTDLLIGLWLLLAIVPLRLFDRPRWRWPATAVLAMVSAGFLYFLAELFGVSVGDDGARGWVMLGSAPVMGTLALPPPDERRSIWRIGRWVGLAAGFAALGIFMVELPVRGALVTFMPDASLQASVALTSLAATVAVGVALEFAKGPSWKVWVHRITIGLVGLQGGLVTLSVTGRTGSETIAPLSLMIGVGLIAAVVLDAAGRAQERKRKAVAALVDARIACPRCGKSLTVALASLARCDRCNLGIEVRVRQDECLRCGYPRTGLAESAPCPECGADAATGLSADRT